MHPITAHYMTGLRLDGLREEADRARVRFGPGGSPRQASSRAARRAAARGARGHQLQASHHSEPAGPAVSARNVHKHYGHGETAVHALNDLSVDFARGAFTAVMGPSGSGKSTLMHCLAGLDDADAGRIVIDDVEVTTLDERKRTLLRRDRLGFVFQAFNLVPALSAEENILLPLTLAGRRVDGAWFTTLVSTLGIGDRLAHRPAELSGGQQQRVAVARALVGQPAIVFADEPTGNLDSHHGSQLLAFLSHAVRELGQSVVMVTHDPVAASHADRVVFLVDGAMADELHDPSVDSVLACMKRLDTTR